MRNTSTLMKGMVLSALAASAVAVCAQTAVMDFKQVYQSALEQDANIRASRAAADSGRERLPQARAEKKEIGLVSLFLSGKI